MARRCGSRRASRPCRGTPLMIYAEITRPGSDPVFLPLRADVRVGDRYRLAVLEMSRRPGVWRIWLDGQPVTEPIVLPGSHKRWQPMVTAESWDGGVATCNGFGFASSASVSPGRSAARGGLRARLHVPRPWVRGAAAAPDPARAPHAVRRVVRAVRVRRGLGLSLSGEPVAADARAPARSSPYRQRRRRPARLRSDDLDRRADPHELPQRQDVDVAEAHAAVRDRLPDQPRRVRAVDADDAAARASRRASSSRSSRTRRRRGSDTASGRTADWT